MKKLLCIQFHPFQQSVDMKKFLLECISLHLQFLNTPVLRIILVYFLPLVKWSMMGT